MESAIRIETMSAVPSEFAGFVHDLAKRAFEHLATRVKELETPLRPPVRAWNKLSEREKDQLIDELIVAAREAEPKKPRKKKV